MGCWGFLLLEPKTEGDIVISNSDTLGVNSNGTTIGGGQKPIDFQVVSWLLRSLESQRSLPRVQIIFPKVFGISTYNYSLGQN